MIYADIGFTVVTNKIVAFWVATPCNNTDDVSEKQTASNFSTAVYWI
jgi:hypothetical protein